MHVQRLQVQVHTKNEYISCYEPNATIGGWSYGRHLMS